jgi:Asp/Glu/hydantoin racemase
VDRSRILVTELNVRIWYQSFVDYENGKTYWDRLRKHLEAVVDPGTTVDIKGITPHDSYAHALVEMRCAREVICNAVRAEREGYDAFVIGHFQDAGLYEARSPSAFRWWRSERRRCCTVASSANAAASSRSIRATSRGFTIRSRSTDSNVE